MSPPVTLVTGASGEIGTALVRRLSARSDCRVLTTDIRPLPGEAAPRSLGHIQGDILDREVWKRILGHRPQRIFHLAALLSTRAESVPELAHRVNVEGSVRALGAAAALAAETPVAFLFPSSIAVYGVPLRRDPGPVREDQFLNPATLYGAQKLYVERLGTVLERECANLDFRAVRFPGLLSAETLPSGGTSDWAPEMIHAAARGESFACFVGPEARLPFCAMPTAVEGVLRLADADKSRLSRTAYNLGGPSLSAEEVAARVRRDFPDLDHTYAPDVQRDRIVQSWPAEVDDRAARDDFRWVPDPDAESLFAEYLIPVIRRRYEGDVP